MTMSCREFRELLDSYVTEELLVETNHEMIRHLETCSACRAELDDRRRLRAQLKSAFTGSADLQMRPAFAATLATRLCGTARPPASAWRRLSSWWALAAAVALVAAIGAGAGLRRAVVIRLTSGESNSITQAVWQLARAAAGDHRDCALHFRLAEKPIPLEEAARRYDPAYHALREAVRATHADRGNVPIDIVEGHSCVFEGRRFAHIVLRYRGELVSVLVTARDGRSPATQRRGSSPAIASLHGVEGFEAATFSAPRHVVFVVSALDAQDTVAVARTIADSMYQHLAGA
jgi:anti-sigma factor RsiW